MKKVLLVTETLEPPYDEGIKKTVYNLYKELKSNYQLKVISRYSFKSEDINIVNANPLFLSKKVKEIIKGFEPDVLIYFPFASATFAGYLRLKVLANYCRKAKPLFISLQPKPLKNWQKEFIKLIKPQYALTPSPQLKAFWDKIQVKSELLPLLTDLETFKPINRKKRKVELRKKYNLPEDAFIVSHMGHLNEGRNLKSLVPLQKTGYQIVVVGSSSTPKDSIGPASIKQELLDEGIIVLDSYIEQIEEIYQSSDLYIFPVVAGTGSIGMPLSIMEARACGIPVVTTDFGSLKHYLKDDFGGIMYEKPENFLEAVNEYASTQNKEYSKTNVAKINQEFYDIIHAAIEDVN
mgnify:CR=1 FL=1